MQKCYWSHDIGGHMPGEVSPELYTRWIQSEYSVRSCGRQPTHDVGIWFRIRPDAPLGVGVFRGVTTSGTQCCRTSTPRRGARTKSLGERWDTPEVKAALADYPNKLARAQAEIDDAMGRGSN